MNRRRFLRWTWAAPLALVWGTAAALQGCGNDAATYPTGGGGLTTPSCDGTGADSMTGTHVHPLCVTQAQLLAAADGTVVTLEAGSVGHTHTITLSGADLANIRDNLANVTVTSSLNGHTHDVTFLA